MIKKSLKKRWKSSEKEGGKSLDENGGKKVKVIQQTYEFKSRKK
jgi:hypothetical protein